MAIDGTTRTQIILAAVSAAGPATDDSTWLDTVHEKAVMIAVMTSDSSSVAKLVEGVIGAKVFTGTVVKIVKEASSTRGLVTLKTKASEHHPDGMEDARTERTDSGIGVAMARRLRRLVGHRVVVWIEVQEMAGSAHKVRVVHHVQDLGVDEATVAELGLVLFTEDDRQDRAA